MEPEGSLSRSQEPVTGPYTEPDESTFHPIYLRSIPILYSHLRLGLPNGLSVQIIALGLEPIIFCGILDISPIWLMTFHFDIESHIPVSSVPSKGMADTCKLY
jgi:hypothetical protein